MTIRAVLEPLLPDGADSNRLRQSACHYVHRNVNQCRRPFPVFWALAGLPAVHHGRPVTHRETSDMRQLVRMMSGRTHFMRVHSWLCFPPDIMRTSWRMSQVSLWVTDVPVLACGKAPELHAAALHAGGGARDGARARGAGRRALSRRSSRYSSWSSFRCSVICVPRPRLGPSSRAIVNDPPACDSQMYCSSSLCCARAQADNVSARAALIRTRWQQGLQWEGACIRPDMRSRRCP